jgi:DNA invertase Pin-like site-specific DNA recombinase
MSASGPGRDGEIRQRAAVGRCARQMNLSLVDWFGDPALAGADPIEPRKGFAALLARIAETGARTIIVETASRLAGDLMVREIAFARLRELGITVVAADSPDAFLDETPTAQLVRQILASVADFDQATATAELTRVRERLRAGAAKRSAGTALPSNPFLVAEAKRLSKLSKRGQRSPREVAFVLACRGYLDAKGAPYSAVAIKSMVEADEPERLVLAHERQRLRPNARIEPLPAFKPPTRGAEGV